MTADSDEIRALGARLERLERQNRTHRLLASFALLIIVWVVFVAQGPPRSGTLSAERFVLLDSNGKPRGALLTESDGSPTLVMDDENGKTRVMLRVDTLGSAFLRFMDGDGVIRTYLSAETPAGLGPRSILRLGGQGSKGEWMVVDGASYLRMDDESHNTRALLQVTRPNGSPNLRLSSDEGKIEFDLTSALQLAFIDKKDMTRALMEVGAETAQMGIFGTAMRTADDYFYGCPDTRRAPPASSDSGNTQAVLEVDSRESKLLLRENSGRDLVSKP